MDDSSFTSFLQSFDRRLNQAELSPFPMSSHFEFFNAAYKGKLNKFKRLALMHDDGKGLAVTVGSIKDEFGRGALAFAAGGGRLNVCKYLLEDLRLDVDVTDAPGTTPLTHAVLGEHFSTVEYLLEKGANPNACTAENFTPLHCAAKMGNKEILTLLLSRGVRVNVITKSGTPLQFAASLGHYDAIKLLLDHHANPNLLVPNIFPPLVGSIVAGSLECVKLLLKAGANPNVGYFGSTPLMAAVTEGVSEMIICLLEAGADPNLTDQYGVKPVEVAAKEGNFEILGILFPVTSRIPKYSDWSIRGMMRHMRSEGEEQGEPQVKQRFHEAKARGTDAFRKNEYHTAIYWYTEALVFDPTDETVLSNRSLCWAKLNDGSSALSDAMECISLKPDWPKAHYRAGVALNMLKMYGEAADAFLRGLMIDPKNEELKDAFREAIEARINSIKV